MRITIPTSLSEITLKQWLLLQNVLKIDQEENFIKLSLITIFCNLTIEEALAISTKDFNDIAASISEVLKQEPTFKPRTFINGKEFGFIPNLDTMTAGEYIDLDKYFESEETYCNAMAVLFRPIVSSAKNMYSIEPYTSSDKYKDTMNDIPLDVMFGAMVFFWNLSKELSTAMMAYLQEPAQMKAMETVLEQNGVGINQYLQSLQVTSSIWEKQLSRAYTSSFSF